jgi:hypothetical protein
VVARWTVSLNALLLALAFAGCGGRSARELVPAPDAESSAGGADNAGGQSGAAATAGAFDNSALAAERCANFALPDSEIGPFAERTGYPSFGACGHLTLISDDRVDIWSPDLRETVVTSVHIPHFSPEGTRAIFVPPAPEDDRVRRLDLLTGATFDTLLEVPGSEISATLDYGLFLNRAGEVESWVCSAGTLRLFADRVPNEADRVPNEAPLFETSVPGCQPYSKNDGALLWVAGSTITAVDLLGERAFTQTPPDVLARPPAALIATLDGFAAAKMVIGDEGNVTGPLYSMRDGSVLAEQWESLPLTFGRSAANSLDHGFTLLIDDGTTTNSVPGLRGVYVFRDETRAFALEPSAAGTAELVYVDFVSGETTPIAEYSSRALDVTLPFFLSFAVSPREHAAYFVLDPVDPTVTPDPQSNVVRWLDGQSEALDETVPSASAIAVADDGTAVFDAVSSSIRFRPGAATLAVPRSLGLLLSDDGNLDLRQTTESSGTTAAIMVTDLASGTQRPLVAGITASTALEFDPARLRLAGNFSFDQAGTLSELWAGRFPAP